MNKSAKRIIALIMAVGIISTSVGCSKSNDDGVSTEINEVASRVGYSNQHYFSQVFKKHTGKSPSKLI